MAQKQTSGMPRLNAFFLSIAFLISAFSQMSGWGEPGSLRLDGPMEQGSACAEALEEVPESADDRPDEEGDWFGRIRHPRFSVSHFSLTAGVYAHPDDDPSGLPPFELEPPPPEC